ncbi:hypothetical protein H0H81_009964 [Sphagnurus paluster]|uniref:Intradiol ring-cleavage dioxygenases domain-containing protein n=1 Tax=Sphagnurus paluster TaxID=117069 RepID=A0A9P7KKY7_9AGAR|nr:hypothetical protein H0H81_009964 [Sphagnurus paluster]
MSVPTAGRTKRKKKQTPLHPIPHSSNASLPAVSRSSWTSVLSTLLPARLSPTSLLKSGLRWNLLDYIANATGEYGGYATGDDSQVHTETFLRGGYYTDANGIVELTTLYPGYYDGRTAHIHTMVHKDWQQNANGTLTSV